MYNEQVRNGTNKEMCQGRARYLYEMYKGCFTHVQVLWLECAKSPLKVFGVSVLMETRQGT